MRIKHINVRPVESLTVQRLLILRYFTRFLFLLVEVKCDKYRAT
jgi:hypothetical protein